MSAWSRSWSLLQWWSWRLLWWSDECVRATDLWAESDGSGWAALLWWGGLYSQHQPMIIMITSQLCPPESKDTKSATHIYQVLHCVFSNFSSGNCTPATSSWGHSACRTSNFVDFKPPLWETNIFSAFSKDFWRALNCCRVLFNVTAVLNNYTTFSDILKFSWKKVINILYHLTFWDTMCFK